MIPITDDTDILSDICLKLLNQYFVLSLGKRLNRESTSPPPQSPRFDTPDLIDDGSKDAHMRDALDLVPSEPHSDHETCQPIVSLDPLDINLLSKSDKVKVQKQLISARKRFTNVHGKVDLTSDLGWRYLKRCLPIMLVRPEEQLASVAKYEQHCGTNIPYSQLSNHRSALKATHSRKKGHENDIIISRASLKKFNLSSKDAKQLIKQAQSCYVSNDLPANRSSM
ncbi:uncharacterized protein LOC141848819 [Brevipalpus obovatus]|uniref:uncharacterized protein LOC141848819 n=1 Tax=Brevipalpus obovatus TaxID=246614 RepID=UPI003D9DC6C5